MPARWIMLPPGGYPYGVEAGGSAGVELHGAFETEEKASQYRTWLLGKYEGYDYAKIVKIETPEVAA